MDETNNKTSMYHIACASVHTRRLGGQFQSTLPLVSYRYGQQVAPYGYKHPFSEIHIQIHKNIEKSIKTGSTLGLECGHLHKYDRPSVAKHFLAS